MNPMPTLTWTCPYDGLETSKPEVHLQDAHNLSIEAVMAFLDDLEARRKEMARLLMMDQELPTVCPLCGSAVEGRNEL